MAGHNVSEQPWAGLYSTALPSTRTGIFYNTFAYPTKISPESVAVYIAAHTKPGDTVLDVFGGTGSTGIAALMCEHPTTDMRSIANRLGITPVWGARNAIVYEIGKFGAFASSVMADPPEKSTFSTAVKQLLKAADENLPGVYDTVDAEGKPGVIRHIIYSDVVACPKCRQEFSYYRGMVKYDPLRIDGSGVCPCCGYIADATMFPYCIDSVYDSLLGCEVSRRRRVPARIYGQSGDKKWVREAEDNDVLLIGQLEDVPYPVGSEAKEIVWGELYRSGYHTGITHLHHFYTKRNFRVMSFLWAQSADFAPKVRDAIRLLLLSYNAAHGTLMTRVVVKKNSKDFVLTSAQSGVLYISSLPVEKNILIGIKRKLKFFEDVFAYLSECSGRLDVYNASSRRLSQLDHSIDYIFTDPPFGDFIPYAEVNQINELWLGSPTDRTDEIIISPSQKKDTSNYQAMITDVFREMYRVLKDDARATVVFHASKATVWNALHRACSDAGFSVDAATSLNKVQASFKQVVSEGSVQGDPLLLLSKGSAAVSKSSSRAVLDEVISGAKKGERQIYADYIGKCMTRGIAVEYDAKSAYEYITQKTEVAK